MKRHLFYLLFIFVICLSSYGQAIEPRISDDSIVTRNCTNCGRETKCTYKKVDSEYHSLYCDECGKRVNINERQGTRQEKHNLNERGICRACGYNIADAESGGCDHIGTILRYVPNTDGVSHKVICDNCNFVINSAEACWPDRSSCEKCGVRRRASFDIPKKVYYIDQEGLKDVNSMQTINQIDINLENTTSIPSFNWTMSTMGSTQYNSSSNNSYSSAASDGTIRFWYNGNGFEAKLESVPKNLSGEVVIKINVQVDDIETSQTIRIIKSGVPKSNCTIYFKNNRVAIDGNELYLLIKTNYNDFSDDEVRKIKEEFSNEFPFYTIQDERIELQSLDENILKIGDYEIKEVTNGYINGYWAKVKVTPKELGKVKIHYKLTTEYSYMNHEPKTEEREGIFFIDVVKEVPESESNWDGNRSPSVAPVGPASSTRSSSVSDDKGEDHSKDRGEGGERDTKSSGGLAMVGVIGLLIVAFIGSKMLNHR